jgi:2-polyprenyl-3-methyl-5-hydroxy-6-metoxy-1,4-benzoquinol methylase
MQVKEFFENTSAYLVKNFGIRFRRNLVSGIVKDHEFKSILDIGCGDGSISIPLLNEERKLYLLDLSENMLKIAASKIPENLKENVVLHNSTLDDFSPGLKFDLIISIGFLAHVPSVKNAVAKMKSLLNKNGKLLIQFSDFNHIVTRMNMKARDEDNHKLQVLRRPEIHAVLKKNNLVIAKEIRFPTIAPGMGKLPDKFLYKLMNFIFKSRVLSFYSSDYLIVAETSS